MQQSIALRCQMAAADLTDVVKLDGVPAITRMHAIRRLLSQAIDQFTDLLAAEGKIKVETVKVKSKKTGKEVHKRVVKYLS